MNHLKISIAMATFNGAEFLKEQLVSLVEQTFLPAELVVTDDGSTDETLAILEGFTDVAPFPVSVHRKGHTIVGADGAWQAILLLKSCSKTVNA